MKSCKNPVVVVSQNARKFFLTLLRARDLVQISYASVRNTPYALFNLSARN